MPCSIASDFVQHMHALPTRHVRSFVCARTFAPTHVQQARPMTSNRGAGFTSVPNRKFDPLSQVAQDSWGRVGCVAEQQRKRCTQPIARLSLTVITISWIAAAGIGAGWGASKVVVRCHRTYRASACGPCGYRYHTCSSGVCIPRVRISQWVPNWIACNCQASSLTSNRRQ
jgi:hypothetical protein